MPAVPKVELPFGPPPVLPDVTKYLEEFLTCPERLPIHNYEKSQQFWHRKPNPLSLLHCDITPLGTTLKFDRDPSTGKLLGYHEVLIEGAGSTSKNSLSFKRAPCPPDEATRGSVNSFPFWPGGFPEPNLEDLTEDEMNIDFENNLLTVPPTFSNGIEFKADNCTPVCKDEKTETAPEGKPETPPPVVEEKTDMNIVDFMSLLQKEEDFLGLWKDSEKRENKSAEQNVIPSLQEVVEESNDSDMEVLSKIITKDELIPVINISGPSVVKKPRTLQWAEEIDVSEPVKDFAKRIPDMAKSWNFELDTFQKQAILKLEEHCNVFVAAHTSAGKTVVAEYAIALSQKNKTRTVYTSPIKALSNQKYRDFKNTFGDVGLITGDLQINQTASCLIMTTEILRSMLYRGSEISRDLEYVIFDEVHYINDSEGQRIIYIQSRFSISQDNAFIHPNNIFNESGDEFEDEFEDINFDNHEQEGSDYISDNEDDEYEEQEDEDWETDDDQDDEDNDDDDDDDDEDEEEADGDDDDDNDDEDDDEVEEDDDDDDEEEEDNKSSECDEEAEECDVEVVEEDECFIEENLAEEGEKECETGNKKSDNCTKVEEHDQKLDKMQENKNDENEVEYKYDLEKEEIVEKLKEHEEECDKDTNFSNNYDNHVGECTKEVKDKLDYDGHNEKCSRNVDYNKEEYECRDSDDDYVDAEDCGNCQRESTELEQNVNEKDSGMNSSKTEENMMCCKRRKIDGTLLTRNGTTEKINEEDKMVQISNIEGQEVNRI